MFSDIVFCKCPSQMLRSMKCQWNPHVVFLHIPHPHTSGSQDFRITPHAMFQANTTYHHHSHMLRPSRLRDRPYRRRPPARTPSLYTATLICAILSTDDSARTRCSRLAGEGGEDSHKRRVKIYFSLERRRHGRQRAGRSERNVREHRTFTLSEEDISHQATTRHHPNPHHRHTASALQAHTTASPTGPG